jgi:hypothetical protein
MTDRGSEEVRPPFHHIEVRLLPFWVVSAGFGFLLSALVWRWEEADSAERWLRMVELTLVGLVNAFGFWAVLRPACFWPRPSPDRSSGPKEAG